MRELSTKLSSTPRSGIRELFDLLGKKAGTISLGIGQPDIPSPGEVIDGTIGALRAGTGSLYAPTLGVPRLRELVASKFTRENGIECSPEANVVITPGGSGAITLAFAALFNPGDELVMFSPNFVSYFHLARFFDARIVEVPRGPGFGANLDGLERAITPRTKAILINSPNNPTGNVLDKKEIEAIASLCIDNDLYLISDEVYEKYLYDGHRHVSPASLNGMVDRVITLNATTKTLSTTGFRIGFLCASARVVGLMENFLQYTSAGVNHPCQHGVIAGLEAMASGRDFLKDSIHAYQKRRDTCHAALNDMGLRCSKPGGAFYIMPDVSGTSLDGAAFSKGLVEQQGVAVVPGATFGSHSTDHVRIAYTVGDETLDEALTRMRAFVDGIQR